MPKSIPKGLTREYVLKAIADLDAGIDHPFGKPTKFELVHAGNRYAPKAVIGIAFRHLTGETLHHREFSGGEAPGQANYELRRLGFNVIAKQDESGEESEGAGVWTEEEVGLLIANYFEMLGMELKGKEYNKAEHNRLLREKLQRRSKGSVEFKHQNVSAVLLNLGLPYIDGYKPARNFQRSLVNSVKAHLELKPQIYGVIEETVDTSPEALPMLESWELLFESPPEKSSLPISPSEPWQPRKGRQIDFVHRDATNRRLGRCGEEFAIQLESSTIVRFVIASDVVSQLNVSEDQQQQLIEQIQQLTESDISLACDLFTVTTRLAIWLRSIGPLLLLLLSAGSCGKSQ
jgi:hypothetical protein